MAEPSARWLYFHFRQADSIHEGFRQGYMGRLNNSIQLLTPLHENIEFALFAIITNNGKQKISQEINMNRYLTLMAIIASCLFGGNAFSAEWSADWKYYGEFTTAPDIKEVMFYDSASIINSNNSIKLWVKTVLYSNLEKTLEDKAVTEKAAAKIAAGYNAPLTKINPKVSNAAYLEAAANEPAVRSRARILYQIECIEQKYRTISGTIYNKDGFPERRLGISNWEYIEPESNADNLAKILCGSR